MMLHSQGGGASRNLLRLITIIVQAPVICLGLVSLMEARAMEAMVIWVDLVPLCVVAIIAAINHTLEDHTQADIHADTVRKTSECQSKAIWKTSREKILWIEKTHKIEKRRIRLQDQAKSSQITIRLIETIETSCWARMIVYTRSFLIKAPKRAHPHHPKLTIKRIKIRKTLTSAP